MNTLDETQIKLAKIASLTAIVFSVVISVALPSAYYLIASKYDTQRLQLQANHSADSISEMIYMHPDTWWYQEPRLLDFLASHSYDHDIRLTIFTESGDELVSHGDELAPPIHSATAPLTDGAKSVGWIRADLSLRPLLWELLIALLGAVTLGIIVNIALRILPFAALRRSMESLSQSQQALQQEIESKDIAYQKLEKLSETIRHQALHDELTNLPNRTYFLQKLANAVNKAHSVPQEIAILVIDLDRFKEINDTLGHHMGDEVLVHTSKRLSKVLVDGEFLARLGGDEYVLIQPNSSQQRSGELAARITEALKPHITIGEYHLNVPGSIGIAVFPGHGESPTQLLRNADIAMYKAKRGDHDYCWYQADTRDHSPDRLVLTAELRHAVDQKRLEMHYQPKIDLRSGKVIGVEALCRWQHPEFGYVSPATFISIAEQAGMINALTDLVLELSLQELSDWHSQDFQIEMAINISARNLQNARFPKRIKDLAEKHAISPSWLLFEITESSIMSDPEQAKLVISEIGEWGAKVAVDDYGTGYSSLSYVKRLAVHELKIDRSFVLNMINDPDDQVIVKSTIDLAHSLNLSATAEGIENERSLEMLRTFGCDYAQGYHICRPLPATEFLHWLATIRQL